MTEQGPSGHLGPHAGHPALQPLGSLCSTDLASLFTPGECASWVLLHHLLTRTLFCLQTSIYPSRLTPNDPLGSHTTTNPVTQEDDTECGPCGLGSEGMCFALSSLTLDIQMDLCGGATQP